MRQEQLILALLKLYGPQPIENIIQIVYAGQTLYLAKQRWYLLGALHRLEDKGLIKEDPQGTWGLK